MTCKGFARALFIATIACIGCSSSTSTQPPSDMDKMAAALDKPNATTTLPASPSNTAPATPQTATQPAAASNASADPSLRAKRGFDLKDWSNEMVFVLVKADVAKTADALAKAWEAKVVKDVLGKPINDDSEQTVVYQLAGHPWSVFACEGRELESVTAALSRDADVLVVWNSDFTAWSGIDLFRGGQEVEALHWGGVGERIGEEADAAKWHTIAEITRKIEGETYTDVFQFRSSLRKLNPADLQKGDAFVGDLFRHYDAYLPDADQMPWPDDESSTFHSPLGKDAFAGVYAVEVVAD